MISSGKKSRDFYSLQRPEHVGKGARTKQASTHFVHRLKELESGWKEFCQQTDVIVNKTNKKME